jgi:hypothetical protein
LIGTKTNTWFFDTLTMIFNRIGYIASNSKIILKDEFIRTGKETVVACFRIQSQNLPDGTEKSHESASRIQSSSAGSQMKRSLLGTYEGVSKSSRTES